MWNVVQTGRVGQRTAPPADRHSSVRLRSVMLIELSSDIRWFGRDHDPPINRRRPIRTHAKSAGPPRLRYGRDGPSLHLTPSGNHRPDDERLDPSTPDLGVRWPAGRTRKRCWASLRPTPVDSTRPEGRPGGGTGRHLGALRSSPRAPAATAGRFWESTVQ